MKIFVRLDCTFSCSLKVDMANKRKLLGWGEYSSVVACVLSMHDVQGSIPNPSIKK